MSIFIYTGIGTTNTYGISYEKNSNYLGHMAIHA